MPNEAYIQTRNVSGELRFFSTLAEAWNYAEKDPTVWKVSFALSTGERVRLVERDGQWVYEDIVAEVTKRLDQATEKVLDQLKTTELPGKVFVIDSLSAMVPDKKDVAIPLKDLRVGSSGSEPVVPSRSWLKTYDDIVKSTIPDPGKKEP